MTEPQRERPRPTPATNLLLLAIMIGLGIEIATGAWTNPKELAELGAIYPPWVFRDGEYWRLLTSMFLHGNGTIPWTILHVATNVFSLYQIGTLYELMFGTRRFVTIYFVTGIAASIVSLLMPPYAASVGASGALFGIMGAFIFSITRSPRFRNHRAARGLVQQVVFWTLANIAIGLQIPEVDNAAHIGGFLAGLLLGALWPHRVPPPPPTQVVVDVAPLDR